MCGKVTEARERHLIPWSYRWYKISNVGARSSTHSGRTENHLKCWAISPVAWLIFLGLCKFVFLLVILSEMWNPMSDLIKCTHRHLLDAWMIKGEMSHIFWRCFQMKSSAWMWPFPVSVFPSFLAQDFCMANQFQPTRCFCVYCLLECACRRTFLILVLVNVV